MAKITIRNPTPGPIEAVGSFGRVLIARGASEDVEGHEGDARAMRKWLGDAHVMVDGDAAALPDGAPVDHRAERIKAVMRVMDEENEGHFTKSGEPRTSVIKDATGYDDVSKDEANARWAEVVAEG